MILYAESSAILAWLLDEDTARTVVRFLADAESIFTSDLTLIECDRVLHRAVAVKELTEVEAADRHAHLISASSQWNMMHVREEIVDRARQPFPAEPIRTLDAIHLASALVVRGALIGVKLLTFDERIRKNAAVLRLDLLPE